MFQRTGAYFNQPTQQRPAHLQEKYYAMTHLKSNNQQIEKSSNSWADEGSEPDKLSNSGGAL